MSALRDRRRVNVHHDSCISNAVTSQTVTGALFRSQYDLPRRFCDHNGGAQPSLNAHAETVLVEDLGLPTNGEMAEVWVVSETADWTFSDWPMIVLGLLIALGGWLVLRARLFKTD